MGNFKDDLLHVWSDPQGGPIPTGNVLHVGLEQDVWDWTVVSAQTVSAGGTRTDAPLLGFHDWTNTVVGAPASQHRRWDLPGGPPEFIVAQGIRIVGPPVLADVSDLWIGNVSGLGLGLAELNRDVFEKLLNEEQIFRVEKFDNIQMGRENNDDPRRDAVTGDTASRNHFEDFILVLEGTREDLPKDILEQGNFLFVEDLPGVKPGEELFIMAQSQTEEAMVMSFGLLGAGLHLFDPEVLKGDFNMDGRLSGLDIDPFILALTDPEAYEEKFGKDPSLVGDLNGDLGLTGLDIQNFINLLTGKWPGNQDLVSLEDLKALANIPEPTSLFALGLAALPLAGSRRSRKRAAA